MIKIIFSDMDGTLLDEQGNLPEEFPQVVEEMKAVKAKVIRKKDVGRRV